MKAAQPRSRHGLTAPMVRVKLRGFQAIDRRMVGAREALAFKTELVTALGGEADLSPQRRRLIDMAARAALLLDHVDAWLFEQRSLVNVRAKTLLPVLVQRQSIADHLARLLDKLGLDRVPTKVTDLRTYVEQRYGGSTAPDGERPSRPARQPVPCEPAKGREAARDGQGAGGDT